MSLHGRLKSERERLGLSQTRMAELLGVGKTTVINWEKGSSAPDAMQLSAFASAGADVLYVVTGQNTPQPQAAPLSAEEAALLDNFRHSDDIGRTAARRLLSADAKRKQA